MQPRPFVLIVATLLCTLAADIAFAQRRGLVGSLLGAGAGAARSGKEAAKTYTDHLTPDALHKCLVTAHDLDVSEEKTHSARARIEGERAAIDKEEADLLVEQKRAMADNAEINKYNARVDRFKSSVDSFNALVNLYEAERRARNASIDLFNNDCAGRKYYVSDLDAIKHKLPFDPAKFAEK